MTCEINGVYGLDVVVGFCFLGRYIVLFTMSTSFSSFESLIYIMNSQYDENLPPYYVIKHIDIVVNVIHMMMQYREMQVVVTNVMLQEPIIANGSTIYISVPLVAMLVNLNVALPKEHVKFATNFNIFKNIRTPQQNTSTRQCIINYERGIRPENSDDEDDNNYDDNTPLGVQFTSIQITRIVQLLRLVLMCAHFYQHYTLEHPTPYLKHSDFAPLELAHLIKEKNRKRSRKSNDDDDNTDFTSNKLLCARMNEFVSPSFGTSLVAKAIDSQTIRKRRKNL